jgi:hypothetical protein
VSARLSPDGMYYWDGQAWRSTLSPDGRFRWDGSTWTPVSSMVVTPYGFVRPQREPTSWTRPLQLAVTGWYVWSIIFTLAEPLWMGGLMNGFLNQSMQRQQQVNPQFSPPPANFTDMMSSFMAVGMWVTVTVYAVVFVVIIVGAWQRWVWMYWVVLVLLGLTSIVVPIDLIYVFLGPVMSASAGLTMPSWLYPLQFITGLPAIGLFVWMLVALVKRGPWAMRRPAWG